MPAFPPEAQPWGCPGLQDSFSRPGRRGWESCGKMELGASLGPPSGASFREARGWVPFIWLGGRQRTRASNLAGDKETQKQGFKSHPEKRLRESQGEMWRDPDQERHMSKAGASAATLKIQTPTIFKLDRLVPAAFRMRFLVIPRIKSLPTVQGRVPSEAPPPSIQPMVARRSQCGTALSQ